MAGSENILPVLCEEETVDDFDEDVDMLDAETIESDVSVEFPLVDISTNPGGDSKVDNRESRNKNRRKVRRRKKRKQRSEPYGVSDINRFVIDTCRHLKEKKSYLVWNAVGCLGVSAMQDLVKEVDTIQTCGGQLTADGKRLRCGGGILWNILKTREPNAYKEIMAKGKEFEKQFRRQNPRVPTGNEECRAAGDDNKSSGTNYPIVIATQPAVDDRQQPAQHGSGRGRVSILNRIRVPVAYDDDLLAVDQTEAAS